MNMMANMIMRTADIYYCYGIVISMDFCFFNGTIQTCYFSVPRLKSIQQWGLLFIVQSIYSAFKYPRGKTCDVNTIRQDRNYPFEIHTTIRPIINMQNLFIEEIARNTTLEVFLSSRIPFIDHEQKRMFPDGHNKF